MTKEAKEDERVGIPLEPIQALKALLQVPTLKKEVKRNEDQG